MTERIIIASLYAAFLIAAIAPRVAQKLRKIETVGCIGIDKRLFFIGKAALFASFIAMPVQAFGLDLSLFRIGGRALFWASVAFTVIGVLFFTLAIAGLGTFSLRVGLAREETALRTTGVYRLSRNPMLMGLFMMAIGSAIYVLNPINWLLVAIAFYVHRRIIIAEEAALSGRFGDAWERYRQKVRRYL